MKNNGFTLLETIIALSLFMLITLSIANLLDFSSRRMERISIQSELLENARISLDMMSVYIRSADSTVIAIDTRTNSVTRISITNIISKTQTETREFQYYPRLTGINQYYHWLWFGGNELATNIADIRARLDGDILSLTVTTDEIITQKTTVPAVSLTTKIKVYNSLEVE